MTTRALKNYIKYTCMIWDYVISGVSLLVTALFVVMAFAVPVRNVFRWRKLEAGIWRGNEL